MVPRPKSPTSLLWAHELKRQHEHLLQRQKDLEIRNENLQKAVDKAETCARAAKDQALDPEQLSTVNATLKEQTTHIETLMKRVVTLEAGKRKMDEDMDKAFERETTTLKRINKLDVVQKEAGNALDGLDLKLDDLGAKEIQAKLLEMEAISGKHGGQLKNLAKIVHENHPSQQTLVSSLMELQRKITTLEAQIVLGPRKSPLLSPEWNGASEQPNGDVLEGARNTSEIIPICEMIPRSVQSAAERLPPETLPDTHKARHTEHAIVPNDEHVLTSPIARKQKMQPGQTPVTTKEPRGKKRPAQDDPVQQTQLRRSQRLARQLIPFQGLGGDPKDKGTTHQTELINSGFPREALAARQAMPNPKGDGQSHSHFKTRRPVLVESKTAANRNTPTSSTLTEPPTPLKTPDADSIEFSRQTELTAPPRLPRRKADHPLSRARCESIELPRIQQDAGNQPGHPETPHHAADPSQSLSKEESSPFQVPTIMLPDYLNPPEWFRPR
ncbi:hypothetical protein EV356DRAFT_532814 [Viridothelium virens]|uniref:Uncharacterized protein n=1 Tax=Viridothelium virens TaxID=1048519 RepID=A0A6A6H8X7_VIRVR|nr:hypothetical protein EV356DRAFT_532814 [Viridothelium virens]